jgi:hypothetical protein
VDPSFNLGSEWRPYDPPNYDIPAINSFASGPEGFTTTIIDPYTPCEWDPAGYIMSYGESNAVQCWSPDSGMDGELPDPLPQLIKIAARWRITDYAPGDGFSPIQTHVTIGRQGLGTDPYEYEGIFPLGNVDWTVSETQAGYTWLTSMLVGVQGEGLALAHYRLWVDWIEYRYADGTPVMRLGAPGWEPKVYRADGTWK